MSVPSISPRLFGRDAQLAALQQRLQSVGEGQGGLALVSGEAGVGKSRLLNAALRLPEATRCAQLRVTCLEGDEAEPYALARALIVAARGHPADVIRDRAPEAERQVRQVQEGLLDLLEEARGGRPMVVTVEDVHWSDGPSLQVLLALALQPAGQPGPFLFMLSYRPQPSSAALAGFLADTKRLRLGEVIHLAPLSTADTARMVRAMLGLQTTLPPGLLHEIMAASEGIPFLVEELLHAFLKQGRLEREGAGWRFHRGAELSVPEALRQAIEGRLLQAPREVIAVAEQAAVAGHLVDASRLAHLCAMDEMDLFAALRALIDMQVLVQNADGTITFRHALTREAIRTRLLRVERQAMHRRVARMLEAEGGMSAAALAYHWAEAGDEERAATYAAEAAEQAAALHAHREAIAHYDLALAGEAGKREAILKALGEHYHALGEHEEAVAYYRQAQVGYQEAGDKVAVALLDLHIGEAYGQERLRKEALESLQAAFEALPEGHPQRWRAAFQLGVQQAASGRQAAAEAALLAAAGAAKAAAAADAAGDNVVARLRVGYELSGLRARRGDWAALEEAAQGVLHEAPEDSDEGLALRHDAHAALGSVAYYRGALQETLAQFTACLHIADRRGLLNDRALAHWNLATNALYHLGRWHEAREHLARMQALALEGLVDAALTFEKWLDGAWEEAAERWLDSWPGLQASDDLEVEMAFGRRIADVLLALERFEEALAFLTPLLDRLGQHQARSYELQLIPRQVEALAQVGDDGALSLAQEGLELARELGGRPAEGLLLRGRALALQQAGAWLDAFASYEAAIGILETLPMPYEAARTERAAGLARLARGRRGDRQRGAALLRRAQQEFADLGARRDENATEAILAAAGLVEERAGGPGPLTAREQEVAKLVTEGLSNGEIAERLYITEKTAAYHVGNILNKLGFNSRVEIAVYMTQQE